MKTLALSCALLAVAAASATAGPGGLNLGWNDCGGSPSTLNRTFACTTNVGINTLVASFVTPCCVTAMCGNELVINVQSTGASLPAWWNLTTGQCRATSLSSTFDFSGGPFTCYDYWQGQASSGVIYDQIVGNRARMRVIGAIPQTSPNVLPIPEGLEVYSSKININNVKSAGSTCPGCLTGVCIVLNSIVLDQVAPAANKFVSAPAVRNFVTWQGGIGGDCLAATPARNATWGSIQALYR